MYDISNTKKCLYILNNKCIYIFFIFFLNKYAIYILYIMIVYIVLSLTFHGISSENHNWASWIFTLSIHWIFYINNYIIYEVKKKKNIIYEILANRIHKNYIIYIYIYIIVECVLYVRAECENFVLLFIMGSG